MTKNRFVPEFFPGLSRTAGAVFALSILLAAAQAPAQGLKPSSPLRLSDPASPARAPAQAGGQRQADFIVVVVNSEPITNSEVRSS
jgi:peptidyl-prolyl cis-trans isomerase SurA